MSRNREKHDFPRKEKVDTNANGCIPTDWKTILTKEHIEDAGNIKIRSIVNQSTLKNLRQLTNFRWMEP